MKRASEVEHASLSIDGNELEVMALDGEEGLSTLFRFDLVAAAGADAPEPESLLAKEAVITLRDGFGFERRIVGIVASSSVRTFDNDSSRIHVTVRPKAFPITLGRDCYVLQDVDVVDVAKDVLFDVKVPVRYEITGSYHKRSYCAQYREDDWTFLSRLLEEEGIYYWFDHDGGETTLVFSDSSVSAADLPGGPTIAFAYETAMGHDEELVQQLGSEVMATSTKFSVTSFDPARPMLKVGATEGEGFFEYYDAPGGGPESPAICAARAKTMREAAEAARARVGGSTTSGRLSPGKVMEVTGHPIARLDDHYLITTVTTTIRQRGKNGGGVEKAYTCRFTGIPKKTPYRHLPVTPRATQSGLQMGQVVGTPGEEIHPNAKGEIRVQHYWDRLGNKDHTAGKWMRVAQRSTPGSMLLPRVGWNVATFNEEGAIDAPSILNRIHDAEHPPAYALPDNKTRVVFKTATSPGAGSFNEIYFEDKKGAEEMFINASRDMNVKVQNLKNEFIYNDSTRTVGANHDLSVTEKLTETVARNQAVKIGGNETVDVITGRGKNVGGNESIDIGGKRMLKVGEGHSTGITKNRDLSVGAATVEVTLGNIASTSQISSVVVGGAVLKMSGSSIGEDCGTYGFQTIGGVKIENTKTSRTLEVHKKFKENVGGLMLLSTAGKFIDNADTTSKWTVGSELSGKAPEVWVEAIQEIRIKCGGSTITILPDSIAIKATEIDLSGASIKAVTAAIEHN